MDAEDKLVLPVAKINELVVHILNINFLPEDLVETIDTINDIIVEFVKALQQVELFLDEVETGLLCVLQTKQLLPHTVGDMLVPQTIKLVLEQIRCVNQGWSRGGKPGT